MKQTNAISRFAELYKEALNGTKIGLILGAGVSHDSKVPGYSDFALKAYLSTHDSSKVHGNEAKIYSYLTSQFTLPIEQREVEPDEVFLLTKRDFCKDLELGSEEWNRQWTLFCATQLYNECIGLTDWRVKKPLYEKNMTLNALITFCAARAQDFSEEPWKTQLQSSKRFRGVGINPRIGGVLTTNYDSLFEAAFNHKYTRSKGGSYGMRPRLEGSDTTSKFDRLPVEHIHGYLSHNKNRYKVEQGVKKQLADFVSTETDYFRVFYESMGFGTYTAMSFLDHYHILFVGCSMEDKNLRRFLFHLKNTSQVNTERFAMMKSGCTTKHPRSDDGCKLEDKARPGRIAPECLTPRDLYYEEVLSTYGVTTIWYCDYPDIPCILKDIYKQGGGNWDEVYKYKRQ